MGNLASRFPNPGELQKPEKFKHDPNSYGKQGTTMRESIKHKNDEPMPIFLRSQNIKMDESIPTFPPEVIIEILSRLPLKILIQSQLVCKDWQASILNHYFTEKYMDRSAVVHYWHNVHSNERFQKKPEHDSFAYLHGCDGLVLLRNKTLFKHILWNPATRRVLELPDPHYHNHGFALSFVPATKSYRIVSFYKDKESGTGEGCEVFTPGLSSNVWRRLNIPETTNSSNRGGKKERVSVVSSGGAVHCVLVTKLDKETNIEIVSLELETENFTVNHFPELLGPLDDWKNYWDMDWDGKLAIVDIVGQNLEVMELEDYKKQRWCENKKIIHLPFLKGNVSVFPLFAKNGEIWLWLKDEKIFTYTIETGELTDVTVSKNFGLANKIEPYKPCLTSFEGMVPDTKLESYRPDFD